jgi:hypothetical protein
VPTRRRREALGKPIISWHFIFRLNAPSVFISCDSCISWATPIACIRLRQTAHCFKRATSAGAAGTDGGSKTSPYSQARVEGPGKTWLSQPFNVARYAIKAVRWAASGRPAKGITFPGMLPWGFAR